MATAEQARLLSGEHLSVDGTPLQAWASQKCVRPKDHDSDAQSIPAVIAPATTARSLATPRISRSGTLTPAWRAEYRIRRQSLRTKRVDSLTIVTTTS